MSTVKNISYFYLSAIYLVVMMLCVLDTRGQDIHYTQFTIQPLQQSPSFAGNFDGDFRLAGLYRNQWATVSVPYNTLGLSADMKVYETKKYTSFLGSGISFFYDQAGDSKLRSMYAQIPLSYTLYIPLNKESTMKLGAGIYVGFLHKSINTAQLTFDNQYTGDIFDPSIPISENFDKLRFLKPDIGLGSHIAFNINKKFEMGLGFGIHHLLPIEESFLENSQQVQLNKRFSLPSYIKYSFNNKWDLQVDYMYQEQGVFHEFTVGAIASYYLQNDGPAKQAIEFGSYYRVKDAVSGIIRYRKNNFLTGFSYDVNVSNLRPATNTYGGIEIGVIYTIKKVDKVQIKNKRKCFVF